MLITLTMRAIELQSRGRMSRYVSFSDLLPVLLKVLGHSVFSLNLLDGLSVIEETL